MVKIIRWINVMEIDSLSQSHCIVSLWIASKTLVAYQITLWHYLELKIKLCFWLVKHSKIHTTANLACIQGLARSDNMFFFVWLVWDHNSSFIIPFDITSLSSQIYWGAVLKTWSPLDQGMNHFLVIRRLLSCWNDFSSYQTFCNFV